jgi:hypothetical protein
VTPVRLKASGLPSDDHGHAGRLCDGCADRTQQHSGESTAAVAADNRQLRRLRLLEKLMRGLVE